MKIIKKPLCVILSIATLLCCCISASANCATFAIRAWNSVASSNLQLSAKSIADQPTKLSKNIITKSGYQSNRSIMNITPIGYVNSNGSFVSVTLNCRGGHGGAGGIHRSCTYNYTPDTLEVA